jgi:quinoprotein dehydrogenase-associated probable ABC transporter substrate-binding protein
MSSAFHSALAILGVACAFGFAEGRELRVCADPDNLPLSHEDGNGFENRIARLVADEMRAELRFEWWPQRGHGFVRKTLGEGVCDVLVGVPSDFDRVMTTRPYYRSTYVFVDGARSKGLETFDDPRLSRLRVGVQLVGDDMAATPPGHALTLKGHVDNIRGFTVFGDGPASKRMIDAVVRGELDAALLWGPQAGFYAARQDAPLEVRVARPPPELAKIPFEYAIAMGVKRGNKALRDELDAILERRRGDIDAILAEYAVPRTDTGPGGERREAKR